MYIEWQDKECSWGPGGVGEGTLKYCLCREDKRKNQCLPASWNHREQRALLLAI